MLVDKVDVVLQRIERIRAVRPKLSVPASLPLGFDD